MLPVPPAKSGDEVNWYHANPFVRYPQAGEDPKAWVEVDGSKYKGVLHISVRNLFSDPATLHSQSTMLWLTPSYQKPAVCRRSHLILSLRTVLIH